MIEDLRAYYCLFWKLGYTVDFITLQDVDRLSQYNLILAPFLLTCSEQWLNAIEEYVKKGGVFYGEPRLSFLDEHGWYYKKRPALQLQKIFGIRQVDIECSSDIEAEKRKKGYWHKENIEMVTSQPN